MGMEWATTGIPFVYQRTVVALATNTLTQHAKVPKPIDSWLVEKDLVLRLHLVHLYKVAPQLLDIHQFVISHRRFFCRRCTIRGQSGVIMCVTHSGQLLYAARICISSSAYSVKVVSPANGLDEANATRSR
jgi:hypothetical protein